MIKKITPIFLAHGKVMLLTFELFWIVVFVLDKLSSQSSNGIPQFIYVNF